ncbi:MAG: hypothetical protein HYS12_29565 [Planctomycetes bacterium]|nr:hypothetical protein [Planctomycetota bacterium]
MPQTCPKCSRINPAEALYCFQDGMPLRALDARVDRMDPGSRPFPVPFVFPSGVTCHTFDQLALACINDWPAAVNLLRQGFFSGFLSRLGRADLAQDAKEAARYPDPDRGLDRLLTKLPARSLTPAKLAVEPRKINLGQLQAGVDRKIQLRLANQGSGLLFGSVSCEGDTRDSGPPWLAVGEGQGVSGKVFQFLSEAVLPVQVRGQHLRAGNKPIQGRISIQSNGGSEVVLVTAEVPVVPFRDGVLAGAKSPRQVAEKSKANPKEAAALFERGAVAAWYKENGWDYPVLGDAASGVAAVQQFFEALGLTAPPKVEISDRSLTLLGKPGERMQRILTISTSEKRPVYARAVSSRPWLKVAGVRLEGRTATVELAVPAVPAVPGEKLEALVIITSNGNQRFEVPVTLSVAATRKRPSAVLELPPVANDIPVLELAAAPSPAPVARFGRDSSVIPVAAVAEPVGLPVLTAAVAFPSRPSVLPTPGLVYDIPDDEPALRVRGRHLKESRWKHALPILFMAVGLLAVLVRDVIVWSNTPRSSGAPDLGDLSPGEQSGPPYTIALKFHDTPEEVLLGEGGIKPGKTRSRESLKAVWDPSMRFGLVVEGEGTSGRGKKLTFEETGTSNNTCVHLDGHQFLFGEKPFRTELGDLRPAGSWPGRWLERATPVGEGGKGRRSVWFYDTEKVKVTQSVEVIRGPQTGRPDTCLVRYTLENTDNDPHRVGLRFLLDTYIGGNDGVPFLIPGRQELCNTKMEFPTDAKIPDFIQALEKGNLTDPGTVAQIQLRVGGGLEPPTHVSLGAYPNLRLGGDCLQEKTLWKVPVHSIQTLHDSAVVLYWDEQMLDSGQKREVGFSYGVGRVAGRQGNGRLALTVGGSFKAGEEFTATAYVGNPQLGQTVTLILPDDFELVEGDAMQTVPMPPEGAARRISPVTWRIRSPRRECTEVLEAKLSTGLSQKTSVKITHKKLFGD